MNNNQNLQHITRMLHLRVLFTFCLLVAVTLTDNFNP